MNSCCRCRNLLNCSVRCVCRPRPGWLGAFLGERCMVTAYVGEGSVLPTVLLEGGYVCEPRQVDPVC